MRIAHATQAVKGWYTGPWDSDLPIAIGYASTGIDAPHLHAWMTEVYLVARGWTEVRVERQTIRLAASDLLILDPGEAHTFLGTSADYLHFVLHVPGLPAAEARADHIPVPPPRLG